MFEIRRIGQLVQLVRGRVMVPVPSERVEARLRERGLVEPVSGTAVPRELAARIIMDEIDRLAERMSAAERMILCLRDFLGGAP